MASMIRPSKSQMKMPMMLASTRRRIFRFALPQCFLGAFALRHIDVCTDNLDKLPARGEHMMADCFEIFDRSIG